MDWFWSSIHGRPEEPQVPEESIIQLPPTANEPDILKCILSWIPIIDLCCWRRVNKTWFQVCSAILEESHPPFIPLALPHSFTVAVYGGPGVGKTSFCYMMSQRRELDAAGREADEEYKKQEEPWIEYAMVYRDDCRARGKDRPASSCCVDLRDPICDDELSFGCWERKVVSFVLMFSVTNPNGIVELEAMERTLGQYLGKDYYRGVVVASKIDLSEERIISKKEGQEFASKIGFRYCEVSNKEYLSVRKAFIVAITEYLSNPPLIRPPKKRPPEAGPFCSFQ